MDQRKHSIVFRILQTNRVKITVDLNPKLYDSLASKVVLLKVIGKLIVKSYVTTEGNY